MISPSYTSSKIISLKLSPIDVFLLPTVKISVMVAPMSAKDALVPRSVPLFTALPAVAQDESIIALSGNAYVTSGHTAYIDENNCAIHNWNDKETVIS